jgi:hypothetical protein
MVPTTIPRDHVVRFQSTVRQSKRTDALPSAERQEPAACCGVRSRPGT